MKEVREIIQSFDRAVKEGRQTALATVVHVEGSSYRRPGARMLVTETGELTGAISGGCLEGDALRKALLAMADQHSRLVTYDTSDEDDATLGIGLGCNGIIQVLFEPLDPAKEDHPIKLLKQLAGERKDAALITLFSLQDRYGHQPGTKLLFTGDKRSYGTLQDETLVRALEKDGREAINNQQSLFKTYVSGESSMTAFVEWVQPAPSLVIVGAGNDAIPLQQFAGILGWQVTVVDGRSAYATSSRFGSSCQIVVAKPERALSNVVIDENTVCILMSHNYNYDMGMLRQLLKTTTPYIGVLGPKKKLDRMLDELAANGITVTAADRKKIFGPVGLDIGAETPEEIALSIVAEIKTFLSGKEGPSLRNHPETIHSREIQEIKKEKIS